MNEKIRALEKNVSEQDFIFYAHKSVYCVYTRNLGANLWLLLGCMSMARLGAKYAAVGCKSMDTFGCMSMPSGCMYAAFGCMYMDQLGACMRLLGACLTVGSLPDSR